MRIIAKITNNSKFVGILNAIKFYIIRIVLMLPIISLLLSFAYTIRYSTIRSENLRTIIILFMLVGLLVWGLLLIKYIIPAVSRKVNKKRNQRRKEIETIITDIKKNNEKVNSIKTVGELCEYLDEK